MISRRIASRTPRTNETKRFSSWARKLKHPPTSDMPKCEHIYIATQSVIGGWGWGAKAREQVDQSNDLNPISAIDSSIDLAEDLAIGSTIDFAQDLAKDLNHRFSERFNDRFSEDLAKYLSKD